MSKLVETITEEIKLCGPITFARFMELALYHPAYGYYTSPDVKIGTAGDFYTAPTVSPLFGAMVARQLEEMWQLAGRPDYWALVEFGPGTGKLARDIMNALLREYPEFCQAVTYHLVEISPGLREQQKRTLAEHEARAKFRWADDLSGINPAGIEGCVLANELVDAFPVHLVRKSEGQLVELFVELDGDGGFRFAAGTPSTDALARYFEMQNVTPEEGQRAEVNLKAGQWLSNVAEHLRRGFILVIDYGAVAADLYGHHRSNGTLRCFHRHRLVDDPLINVGSQDITAHVNYTALAIQGKKAGLHLLGPVSQPRFLLNLGILDAVQDYNNFTFDPEMHKKTMAIKQLVLPGGMGDIFKIMVFNKGIVPTPKLTGLSGPQTGV